MLRLLTGNRKNEKINTFIMPFPPKISEEMRLYFRYNYVANNSESLSANQSLQNILIEFKNMVYSQMQAVFLLMEELGISFLEANRIVLNSTAWNS